ncbi:MAG: hypothetical protein KAI24_01380 [Planctomycetes bacterium]|nr:hypothetical protein [Planctomycetota bacterium]
MRALLWLPLLALTAGCWQPRYFAPRENVSATSPEGFDAAAYRIGRDGDQRVRGELRVWSGGAAARFTDDGVEVVDLKVSFELENNGEVPLELDPESVRIEELMVDGYLQEPLSPESRSGDHRAVPGSIARLDFVFRPPTTYPARIESFDLRFELHDGVGKVGQVTPFAPVRRSRARFDDDPYWGAGAWGWGGYWGWGYGWRAGPGFYCR